MICPGEGTSSLLTLLCFSLVAGCTDHPTHGSIALEGAAPSAWSTGVRAPAPTPGDLPVDGVLQLAYAPVATELDDTSWQPIIDHLVRRLGVLIEPVPYDSYEAIVDAVALQQADLALLAPLSYVLAKDRLPGLEPLVHTLSEGKTSYSAYLFVERASPYQQLADLQGARVAFVDERSTSGFLMPYAQLLDAGLHPERDLGEMLFVGDHVGTLRAVAQGRADAAASYADVLPWASEQALAQGWEMPAFRLLGAAGRIPLDALCAGPQVSSGMKQALEGELLAANTSSAVGRAFFVSSGRIVGWAESSDDQYDGVRQVQRRVRAARERAP
jgi:phosphate/phosphite/phosphonate ABC transporter binding protein